MFSVTHPALSTHSSEQIELVKYEGETSASHRYEAKVHHTVGRAPSYTGGLAPSLARAILGKDDNRMRVHIRNVGSVPEARPMTPRLQTRACWLTISRNAQDQRNFLDGWQLHRGARLVDELEFSSIIAREESHGRYAESQLDGDVACVIGASCTGSVGAGNSIVAFLRGTRSDGEPIMASIHKHVSLEQPYSPETAYEEIIFPLEMKMAETLAINGGHVLMDKHFYFTGGNSQTLESCAALAFTAQQHQLSVPVSMLAMNDDTSYVNAMLGRPIPVAPNGVFFVARVHEDADDE